MNLSIKKVLGDVKHRKNKSERIDLTDLVDVAKSENR